MDWIWNVSHKLMRWIPQIMWGSTVLGRSGTLIWDVYLEKVAHPLMGGSNWLRVEIMLCTYLCLCNILVHHYSNKLFCHMLLLPWCLSQAGRVSQPWTEAQEPWSKQTFYPWCCFSSDTRHCDAKVMHKIDAREVIKPGHGSTFPLELAYRRNLEKFWKPKALCTPRLTEGSDRNVTDKNTDSNMGLLV